jgi:hypothetical protein
MTTPSRLRLCRSDVAPTCRHHLSRFAFRAGLNRDAQALLAEMRRQMTAQLDGVLACDIVFDRATGEWVEHVVWRPDRAPNDAEVPPDVAHAVMRRLQEKA